MIMEYNIQSTNSKVILRWKSKVSMRIEGEIKLAFDDVMIRPKRSTLVSRSDVTLERKFSFKHTPRIWRGVPISAANMDTTGVFDVAKVLQSNNTVSYTHLTLPTIYSV